jgi:RNA polymerase sigma-70 factor (ECF subfamily)
LRNEYSTLAGSPGFIYYNNKFKTTGNGYTCFRISISVNRLKVLKEQDLIRKCQRDDRKAQEHLYAVYADRLYRLALRYIKSGEDAEDVTMAAFIKIFKSINSFIFQGEGSLEAWMRQIFINESLMWLRRRHNFSMTESLEAGMLEPDLKQLTELEAEDIYKLIAKLPIGYRTVFNLNVIEGYNHQEIGLMLSITESTSRTQLFKAKTILKKMLTKEGYRYGT